MVTTDDIVEAVNDADFDVDFKGIFTIAKSIWTIRGIHGAIETWRRSDSALSAPAVRLLTLNALLVLLTTAYKLTRREIAPLFVLQCLGHYSCFLTFATLAGFGSHPKIKKGRRGNRRIGLAIWTLHGMYALVLVLGFRRAECVEGAVYPMSFAMNDGLFLASYALLLFVKKRGFDVRDLKEDDEVDGDEDLELFEAQISAFFKQQRVLVIWHSVEMIFGYFLLNRVFEDAVSCDENGEAWNPDMMGKLFILLHTFGVKQSLGVASKVFFKTAKGLDKKQSKGANKKKAE